jgi:hypothetical protein
MWSNHTRTRPLSNGFIGTPCRPSGIIPSRACAKVILRSSTYLAA